MIANKKFLSIISALFFIFANAFSQTNVDSLISKLLDKNQLEAVRLSAAEKLGTIEKNDTNTIKALIACFTDENLYLRGKAATSLGQIGKNAVSFLNEALHDENENVRWSSAIALSKMGEDAVDASSYLAEALEDKNENVIWCSLISLGNIGEAASQYVKPISKFLNNDNEDLKWAAVYALGKINIGITTVAPSLEFVTNELDSMVPGLMKDLKISGVSICLVENRKIAWQKSYGVKNARTNEPVTNVTMFEACSMTKPVFAYLVLKLVEERKLNLDEPLANYLDEKFISLSNYDRKITARMILCHTSGLPNWRKGFEETEGPLPVYFEPGSKFSYSGEGFYYLQRVVEKITGEPIDVYAKKTLFDPLGLNHTSFSWSPEFDTLISAGHDTSGSFLQKTKYTQPNAAYTLYTTPEDYTKFVCNILDPVDDGTISLSKNTIAEMMKHQVRVLIREPINRPGSAIGFDVYWGLGWAVDSTAAGDIVYHSGANQSGFRCYSQFNYERGTAIVIMTNGLNGSEFWRNLIRRIGDF